MRVETKEVTWYSLTELKKAHPSGYEKAIDNLRTTLWAEGMWTEDVGEEIATGFDAEVAGSPSVKLTGWDLERGSYVALEGTLYPADSVGLPWHEWLDSVVLTGSRHGTTIMVRQSDDDDVPYIGWGAREKDYTDDQRRLAEVLEEMREAVREALEKALAIGRQQAEWLESEDQLLELAEGQDWEFDQHGVMA